MKKLYAIVFGLILLSFIFPQDQEIDSSQDEIKVQDAVVEWANNTFYAHSNYKFEHFHAFYTDEYFIAVMRADMFKDRLTKLEKRKTSGAYTKSDEEYEKEYSTLKSQWEEAQKAADNFEERVSYYEIHFWSNIQTTDGITVYYELIVKLDNGYAVSEYTENSAIGKKDGNTKILFKKDIKTNTSNR